LFSLADSSDWIWWYINVGKYVQGPYSELISSKVNGLGVGEAVGVAKEIEVGFGDARAFPKPDTTFVLGANNEKIKAIKDKNMFFKFVIFA
jgi:hypothetical protein